MGVSEQDVRFWDAVNEYAESCGGDTSFRTVADRRMNAVAAIERLRREASNEPAERELEELRARVAKLEELRPDVRWFAEKMELKLRKNDHKPGWRNDSPRALFKRLVQEADELIRALLAFEYSNLEHTKVADEAADVANFAMMIADVVRQKAASAERERDELRERVTEPEALTSDMGAGGEGDR